MLHAVPTVAVLCMVLEGDEGVLRIQESARSFLACGATALFVADMAPVARDMPTLLKQHTLTAVECVRVVHCAGWPHDLVFNTLADAAAAEGYTFALLARSHDLLKQTSDGQMVEALPANLIDLDVLQVCSDCTLRPRVDVCVRLSMFYFVGALMPLPVLRPKLVAWYSVPSQRVCAQLWHNVSIATLPFMQTVTRACTFMLHTRLALERWQHAVAGQSFVSEHDRLVGYVLTMQAAGACLGANYFAEAQRMYGTVELEDVSNDRELYFAARLGACRAALRSPDEDAISLSSFAKVAEIGLGLGQVDGVSMLHRALIKRGAPHTASLLLQQLAAAGPAPSAYGTDPSLRTYRMRALMAMATRSPSGARAVLQYGPMTMNDDACTAAVKEVGGGVAAAGLPELPHAVLATLPPAMTLCQPQFLYHPGFLTQPAKLFDAVLKASAVIEPGVRAAPGWPLLLNLFQNAIMPNRRAIWGKGFDLEHVARTAELGLIYFETLRGANVHASAGYIVLLCHSETVVKLGTVGELRCAPGSLLGVHESLACVVDSHHAPLIFAQIVPVDV